MPMRTRLWWKEVLRRWSARPGPSAAGRRAGYAPRIECLEDRTLLSGNPLQAATPLTFTAFGTAQASHFLSNPHEVDLYRVTLGAGDRLDVSIGAEASGSGLRSLLRIFDSSGTPLALDDQEGGDPGLTFQAATAGDYFVGVSSAPNDNYDPTVPGSGTPGGTTGLYTLNLRDTPLPAGTMLQPDVAGSSFRLTQSTAVWGDTLSGTFTVANRGGADATGFTVQVMLSGSNLFNGSGPSQTLSAVLTASVPADLGPGAAFTTSFSVRLPATPPASFPTSGPVYLGLLITPGPGDSNTADKSGVQRGEDWDALTVVTPAPPGQADLAAVDANLNTRVNDALAATGDVNDYTLTVTAAQGSGRLTALVTAAGGALVPRLTLSAAGGQELIQSDQGALAEDLQPGTYILTVSAASGAGGYQMTTEFMAASPPVNPLPAGTRPDSVALADVNGDGLPDLIVANAGSDTVSVLLGNGDGSFRPARNYAVGHEPGSVVVADLTGDGKEDIVAADYGSGTVSVLLGNGDGSFQAARDYAAGAGPISVAAADFTGDGIPDLVVVNRASGTVSVLLGSGDGSFQAPRGFAVGSQPVAVAVADLTGDGIPDLVVANKASDTVSVLLGNGDGTFQPQQTFATGIFPDAVAVADVNGDGKPDLVVANSGDNTVSVLLGNGDGTFQQQQSFATGVFPDAVAVADVNGDGKPDLVVANESSDNVSVLLGNGDGTFQTQRTFAVGSSPGAVAVADVNGDGKPDLIVANATSDNVSVLPGAGDGTFQVVPDFAAGSSPGAVAVADVNGDGIPDLVVANTTAGTVSVLLGNGDGTFQTARDFAVGADPVAVAVADLNNDGRPDLVVANAGSNTVSVLLGNGDGSFQPQQTVAVGDEPVAVAVADLTGDGDQDLVVADYDDNTVSVLLGNGDGSFQTPRAYAVGSGPIAVAVAHLTGHGKGDLVVANHHADNVSVLLGNGDGTFQQQQTFAVGSRPRSVAVADLTGDGIPDLVVANAGDGTVSVLLGDGAGSFQHQQTFAVGIDPFAVAVADLTGDGIPDLVVANVGDNDVSVLLGNGDGTFQHQQTFAVGSYPFAVAAADVNGDGIPDLVTANSGSDDVNVLLGAGDGSFTPATPADGVGLRDTPYLADLTGAGTADSVILDSSGNIRFRQGVAGTPVTLNAGRPARDLAVLKTATGWALATADARFDPTLSSAGHFVYTVSLYTVAADGTVTRATAFSTPFLPTRIAAADLTGDGLDDLVVADALDDSVQVAFQQPDDTFSPPLTLPVGVAPSDITFADVNGLLDIVVSNQASGTVTVLLNDDRHSFAAAETFPAGTALSAVLQGRSGATVNSLAQSVSLAAGDFTGGGRQDLVVVDRGTYSFSVLANDGSGGFAAPRPGLTTSLNGGGIVNDQPGPVVAGTFTNGSSKLDLAILMEDQDEVWIYTGRGDGTFTHTASIAVGALATGLSLVPGSGAGRYDLLVGDEYGDILRLVGDGNGSFAPPAPPAGTGVSVSVGTDAGRPEALVANEAQGQIVVETPVGPGSLQFVATQTVAAATAATPFVPADAQWVALDENNPTLDAVAVDGASNSLQIYRPLPGGGYARTSYIVGTDPVSVTIAAVHGDGIPDLLVANKGSNDVSVFFGAYDANGRWVPLPGPRLASGGTGPLAANPVADPNSPGGFDLAITNSQGGVSVLPGRGQGFFDDRSPQTLPLPSAPAAPPSFFEPGGDLGVLPLGDGRLYRLDFSTLTALPVFTPAGPVMALQALPNGDVVVAEQGGAVQVLQANADDSAEQVVETVTLLNPPSDPSALDVLGEDVFVTNAGSNQLFVYVAGVLAPVTVLAPVPAPAEILLPTLAAGSPGVEESSPAGAPLTVFLTLVAGVLPATSPADTTTAGDLQFAVSPAGPGGAVGGGGVGVVPAADLPFQGAAAEDGEGDQANKGDGNGQQPPAPETERQRRLKELLKELDLYRPSNEALSGAALFGLSLAALPPAESDAPPGGPTLPPGPAEFEGATAEDAGEQGRGVSWAAATAGAGLPVLPPAGGAAPAVRVLRVVVGWGRALLPALAAGGLTLWTERGLRRAERSAESGRRGKPRLPGPRSEGSVD
jgi:hypothetical protein